MAGRGAGRNAGWIGAAVVVLALGGITAGAITRDDGKGRDAMSGTGNRPGTAGPPVPAIDRDVPAKVETAIFALG